LRGLALYFSAKPSQSHYLLAIVDVIAVLTESVVPAAYWRKLKQCLEEEGNETVTICHGLVVVLLFFSSSEDCFIFFLT
jgi:hypothetical protein